MKNLLKLLAICLFATTFQSCFKDKCERELTYIKYTPVYLTADEIRVGITFENSKSLENPGKIYYYNNHIFINEIREGVHIIDNNDPANPVNIGFISIPGNVDIAIHNNILYADNYIDLLSIDITDFTNPQILDREEEAFSFEQQSDIDSYLVYYEEEEVTETVSCGGGSRRSGSSSGAEVSVQFDNNSGVNNSGNGGQVVNGIAGSMARFSLIGAYLYIVDEQDLYVYDITTATDLQNTSVVNLGWGIETIFPYRDHLFIGSNTGMFIYDNSNPALPVYVSEFSHAQACDPVYVKDEYAYVTLRGGTPCQNFENQLDVIDISDLENPVLASTIQMENPHGLSIKEDDLYVCEGDFGFKTFDITDPLALDNNMKSHFKAITSYDVIALPGLSDVIMIIGKDGFFQFDVSDLSQPRLISSILVEE